jgi:cell division septum initiation protein DivIVA
MDETGTTGAAAPLMARHVIRSDFRTVRRGFDRDEVVAYLGQVAEYVADLEARMQDLEAKLTEQVHAEPSEDDARRDVYERAAGRIADLVRTFDSEVERMKGDAQSEADRILEESRAQAERLRSEAEKLHEEATAESQRVVAEARWKADSMNSDLRARRTELIDSCRRIQEGLRRSLSAVDRVLSEVGDSNEPSGESRDEPVVIEDARFTGGPRMTS